MENLNLLLKRLLEAQVDFILIGGYSAVIHGSSQVTHDLDICAVMTDEQLDRLKTALKDLDPRHRMNPTFQPSLNDTPKDSKEMQNYYLRTKAGVLDILAEVSPVGDFQRIKEKAITVNLFNHPCHVISLDDLITVKSAMNRPKDKFVLDELLAVKKMTR